MITDPEYRAAAQYAVRLSADIELQLNQHTGGGPVVALLKKARGAAAESIVALAEADAEDPKGIRTLQNDIICFHRILTWLREIVRDGIDAGHVLDDDAREDFAEAIGLTEDEADDLLAGRSPATD